MIIKCPHCNGELELEEEFAAGTEINCSLCNTTFAYGSELTAEEQPAEELPAVEEAVAEEVPAAEEAPAAEEVPAAEAAAPAEAPAAEAEDPVSAAAELVAEKLAGAAPEKPTEGGGTPKGKIYADSMSLYDDEARVAFDYFKQAAERIVAEEDAVKAKEAQCKKALEAAKGELAAAEKEVAAALADAQKAKLWFIGFFLVIPLIVGIMKLMKAKQRRLAGEELVKAAHEKIAAREKELTALAQEFKDIKRDYTISKLGIAYVPIATEVPFEDKSFILDDTKKTGNSTFDLYQVKAQDEFIGTLTAIKARENSIPIAETGVTPESIPATELVPSFSNVWMNDYLGGMDRDLRAMTYFLRDLKKTSVSLPVITPKGEYARFLDEYCTSETGSLPVLDVFDNSSYVEDLRKFEEINEMKKKMTFSNESLDDVLQGFISEIAENVQLVGRAKIASIGKVLSSCGETLLNTFKASYNHFSPDVAREEIERLQQEDFAFRSNDAAGIKPFLLSSGSRVRYDAVSNNWVADDGARVAAPFGIHQIQEEIISPLVQNLLRETRVERLRIVNNIVDKKLENVREWQREVDDFYGRGRAEGNDIINQMQVVLGEFTTAYSQYQAFKETERQVSLGDDGAPQNMKLAKGSSEQQILAFKEQAERIEAQKNEFNDYVERLQGDIEQRAAQFSYTEDYEATLRDRHAKDAVMSLLAVDKLDERRRVLLAANPYIAENAQLPPEATVNAEALYGRLGKDLCATADELVESIGTEIKEEAAAAAAAAGVEPDAEEAAEPSAEAAAAEPAEEKPAEAPAAEDSAAEKPAEPAADADDEEV